jgi:hypothetical protein
VAFKQAKRLLGANGWGLCFGTTKRPDGTPTITVDIPLSWYLAQWPDEAPEVKSWDDDGVTRTVMTYPSKFAGHERGIEVWVQAATRSAVAKAQAIADAQGGSDGGK